MQIKIELIGNDNESVLTTLVEYDFIRKREKEVMGHIYGRMCADAQFNRDLMRVMTQVTDP